MESPSLSLERHLTERVTRFGRLLRGAGLKLGPGHVIRGLEALSVVDITPAFRVSAARTGAALPSAAVRMTLLAVRTAASSTFTKPLSAELLPNEICRG